MNLFLALAAEHKQRTGHDIFNQKRFDTTRIHCDVCLYLSAEKRKQDEVLAAHFEHQRRSENESKS